MANNSISQKKAKYIALGDSTKTVRHDFINNIKAMFGGTGRRVFDNRTLAQTSHKLEESCSELVGSLALALWTPDFDQLAANGLSSRS
ncbi:MAG: hypothetical protein LKH29_04965 [Eggerthellaceae bacterium]|jgi:hypothetical protein|nr:hypothetical protein [Eggerthellaceae bacterium]